MAWVTTKDGRRVYTDWFNSDNNKPIISKHSGDEITLKMSLESWAKNANGIRHASMGEKYDGSVFGKVGLNDEAKSEQIINFVKGNSVNEPIYRGISDITDTDYTKYTKVGSEVEEKGLSSWSTDKRIAVGYGQYNNGITFVKESNTSNAHKLGNRTGTDSENEVIVYDNKSKIVRVKKDKYTTYVYLK